MSSREGDMKRSAVRIIAVLAVMFAVAAAMLVWLVGNEFEAENQLNEVRAKLGELGSTLAPNIAMCRRELL